MSIHEIHERLLNPNPFTTTALFVFHQQPESSPCNSHHTVTHISNNKPLQNRTKNNNNEADPEPAGTHDRRAKGRDSYTNKSKGPEPVATDQPQRTDNNKSAQKELE
ncbi:hypothetical protein MTR_7g446220 [Medicago truncatula]|uniref:Uncharacterized protein n=1 Tax=Medicago truncatula TaxID=3880 RepID=A0A072U9B7_MEDTR|nr:hypothetical protein MTR_7g446220 [Medicago truncatula]